MTTPNKPQPKKIQLFPLIYTPTELQLKVREIRNDPDIRKWMYTDHVIELNEHLSWLNKIKTDQTQIVFVVLDEESCLLGVVNVSNIDLVHNKAEWGYYLKKEARGGLGTALNFALINFIFNELNIQKLNGAVLEGNNDSISLHKRFLFQEEGFRRANILKEEEYIGVHLYGLTRKEWLNGKEQFFEKYKSIMNKFSISIKWDEINPEKKQHPIDAIEAARARNNLNWMSILRLVLELSPEHGKDLVTDIRNIDKEISALTDKLISL